MMARRRIFFFTLLSVISLSNGAGAESDAVKILQTTSPAPNSFVKVIEKVISIPSVGQFSITVVAIDTRKQFLKLAIPSESSGSSLSRYYGDEGALAALSAGFLRTYSPVSPAGLVKANGETLNTLSGTDPVLNGIVCIQKDSREVKIASRSEASVIDGADDCIQAGPLLVGERGAGQDLKELDSSVANFSSRQYERTFVAKDKHGTILLGYASPTSLFALRNILIASESDGGFEVSEAIGLTGGAQSAGLIVRTDKKAEPLVRGNIGALVPNAWIVYQ